MNEINVNASRLEGADLLSVPGIDIGLRKIGHISYAITEKGHGMRFAFASAELTKYLGRRKHRKITDVKLLKQSPIVAYEEDETLVLQRLRDPLVYCHAEEVAGLVDRAIGQEQQGVTRVLGE